MPKSAKITILGAFLGAMSLAYWIYIERILFQAPETAQLHFWSLSTVVIFSVLTLLLVSLCALIAFIVGEGFWAYLILALGSLPFFIPISHTSPLVIGAFVVFVLSLLFMRSRVASENASRITISVEKVLPQHLSVLFFTLPMLVAAVFYISPAPKQIKDIKIPRELFQKLITPIEAVFAQRAEIPAGGLQDVLRELSAGALPGDSPGAVSEPEFAGIRIPFFSAEGQPTAYSEFSDALYEAANARIAALANLPEKTQQQLAIGLASAVFVSMRLMLIPIGWAVIILTIILWNILTYVGFVKIGTVQVEKEIITL